MEFEFMGYHFIPCRTLSKKWNYQKIMWHTKRSALDLHNYAGGKGWNYAEFYEKAQSDCDTFTCLETGREYIPAENELFLFV